MFRGVEALKLCFSRQVQGLGFRGEKEEGRGGSGKSLGFTVFDLGFSLGIS